MLKAAEVRSCTTAAAFELGPREGGGALVAAQDEGRIKGEWGGTARVETEGGAS